MARDLVKSDLHELAGLVGSVARDAQRLVGQHVELLRSEVRQGVREAPTAMVDRGGGRAGGDGRDAGHVDGRAWPPQIDAHPALGMLWFGWRPLAAAGGGLIAAGTRRAASISFVPRETIAALGEDLEWLNDQFATPAS